MPPPPSDDPNARFKRRRVDDEDDRPARRRRVDDDDDDDEDESPRRSKPRKAEGVSPFAVVALGAGLLTMCGCCGGGVYLAFFTGGGGGSTFGGSDVTIVEGSRQPAPFGGTSQVRVKFKAGPGVKAGQQYTLVAQAGGRTATYNGSVTIFPNSETSVSWPTPELNSAAGPVEVWVAERNPGGGAGRKVSNSFTVR